MPKCDFIEISKCNFIEITLRHGCSSIHLLHIFRTLFYKNTSGGPLLLFLKLPSKKASTMAVKKSLRETINAQKK